MTDLTPAEPTHAQRVQREWELDQLDANPNTPWDTATVDGCDCGGITSHRPPSGGVPGYGCPVLDLPAEGQAARINAAIKRVRRWSDSHPYDAERDAWDRIEAKLDRVLELLEDRREATEGFPARPFRVALHGLRSKTTTPLTEPGTGYQVSDRIRGRRQILQVMWRALRRGRADIVAEVQFVEAEPFDLAKGHDPDHYHNGWHVPGGLTW